MRKYPAIYNYLEENISKIKSGSREFMLSINLLRSCTR